MMFFRPPARKSRLALCSGGDPDFYDEPLRLMCGDDGDGGGGDGGGGDGGGDGGGGEDADMGGLGDFADAGAAEALGGGTADYGGFDAGNAEDWGGVSFDLSATGQATAVGGAGEFGGATGTSRGADFAYGTGREAKSAYDALTAAGFPDVPGNMGFAAPSSYDKGTWGFAKDLARGASALLGGPLALIGALTDPNAGPPDRESQASYDEMDATASGPDSGDREVGRTGTGTGDTARGATATGPYDAFYISRLKDIDEAYGTDNLQKYLTGEREVDEFTEELMKKYGFGPRKADG